MQLELTGRVLIVLFGILGPLAVKALAKYTRVMVKLIIADTTLPTLVVLPKIASDHGT